MNTVPFIDFHCDTLMQAWFRRRKEVYSLPPAMADVKRLKQGGAKASFCHISSVAADEAVPGPTDAKR